MSAPARPTGGPTPPTPERPAAGRSPDRLALALVAFALAGVAIALYLTYTKLSGGTPYCGPLRTCETVQSSPYAELLGIPVSLLGAGYMVVALALVGGWWRTGRREPLLALYGLSLAGVLFVAYLTYVELFVLSAVCPWCVAYAVAVVAILALTVLALRRARPG